MSCSICGEPGHNKATCPKRQTSPAEPPQPPIPLAQQPPQVTPSGQQVQQIVQITANASPQITTSTNPTVANTVGNNEVAASPPAEKKKEILVALITAAGVILAAVVTYFGVIRDEKKPSADREEAKAKSARPKPVDYAGSMADFLVDRDKAGPRDGAGRREFFRIPHKVKWNGYVHSQVETGYFVSLEKKAREPQAWVRIKDGESRPWIEKDTYIEFEGIVEGEFDSGVLSIIHGVLLTQKNSAR